MSKKVEFLVTQNSTQKQSDDAKLVKGNDAVAMSTKRMADSMRSARFVGLSFNRVIQDAPFFMQSMQMGILAVSNNVTQLTEAWAQHRMQFNSSAAAIKAFLPTLVSIPNLISLAVSAVLAYSLATRNSKNDTEEMAESWDKLAIKAATLKTNIESLTDSMKRLNLEQLRNLKITLEAQARTNVDNIKKLTRELENQREALRAPVDSGARVAGGLSRAVISSNIESTTKTLTEAMKLSNEYAKSLSEVNSRLETFGLTEGSINLIIKQKRDELKELVIGSEEYKRVSSEIIDLQNKLPSSLKETAKSFKELTESLTPLESALQNIFGAEKVNQIKTQAEELANIIRTFGQTRGIVEFGGISATPDTLSEVGAGVLPNIEAVTEDFGKIAQLGTAAASVIGNSFTRMWENVFGEANSLFEQLVKTMVSTAAGLGTQGLFTGLISSFVPGGSFISGFLGALGINASRQNTPPQTITIDLAGQKLNAFVKDANAVNLRYATL
jgi:hypothetical protein